MKLKALSLLSVLSILSTPTFADSATELFNPNPDKSDVILSMPCDGIMVFKKVYTTNDERKIKDKAFLSGSSNTNSPMSQALNTRYIQGSFKDKNGYYYLIAKYELLKGQYDILMNNDGKCPTLNKMSRLPAVKISYFDAINAANKYSVYLLKAKDAIKENSQIAYTRLASDEEWEFACRGGNNVTQSEFDANLPPMKDGELNDYAWYQGAQSSNGKLQLAGLKKPNPLGLYDMLGNAQEITSNPFKAVRAGRLLGLSGGMCVRGGSYLTSKDNITSANRTEKPFYLNGKELSANDTSTRFVLSLSVASNNEEAKKINEDLLNLGDNDEDNKNALSGEAKELAKLNEKNEKELLEFKKSADLLKQQNEQLSNKTGSLEKKSEELLQVNKKLSSLNEDLTKTNVELNKKLVNVQQKILQANSDREAMQDNAVTANLRLGGFLCSNLNYEKSSVDYFSNILKVSKKQCESNKDRCATYEKLKAQHQMHEKTLTSLLTYYGDTISNANANYPKSLFKKLVKDAQDSFGLMDGYDTYVELYLRHLLAYAKSEKNLEKNQKLWLKQCSEN